MAEFEIVEDDDSVTTFPLEDDREERSEIREQAITTAMVSLDQGKEPVQAFTAIEASGDIESSTGLYDAKTDADRRAQMEVGLEVLPREEVLNEAVQFTGDMSGENGVLGSIVQKIKTMPSSQGKSEEHIKELAFSVYHRQQMAQFQPEDIGEGLQDFGGVFIPKRKGEATVDLAVSMGFIEDSFLDKAGVFVDPIELLNKMRNVFLSLEDSDEKALYIKEVTRHIDKASDNNFVKSEMMTAIFGEGSTGLDEFFEVLDLAAIAEVPVIALKVTKGILKGGSLLNVLRKNESIDTIADTIRTAEGDLATGKVVGISQADVGDAVNPTINGEIAELIEGADADQAAQIKHMIDLQDSQFLSVFKEQTREGLLDQDEIARVMRASEIRQLKKPGIVEVSVKEMDETGFIMQSTTAYMDEVGEIQTKLSQETVSFRVTDQGKMESDPTKSFGSFFRTDPNNRFTGKLRNWFVSTIERLSRSQAKTTAGLDNMMVAAFKGLDAKGAAKVDNALMKGSDEGVQYTFAELKTQFSLTDKEAKAYIGFRNVVSHIYSMKNKQIVDTYNANGIKLVDSFEGVVPAKSWDDAEKAFEKWMTSSSDSRHINITSGELKQGQASLTLLKLKNKGALTKEMVESAYEQGYVLSRTASNSTLFRRGDVNTQWAFVKKESVINPTGQQVIQKIPGYVPRQRTNGHYFIKSTKRGTLSGADDLEVGVTVAWSDSKASAQRWIDSQDDPSKFMAPHFDRDMGDLQRTNEVVNTTGGLFNGARKSTELEYVGDGNQEFANSFEAIQNYINHIGRQFPATLYRLGAEQRLLGIAESLGVKGATGLNNVLEKAVGSGIREFSKEYKMLEKIHDQVAFLSMVPTSTELAIANKIERLGNALEGPLLAKIPGWDKVPKFFYRRASAKAHPADVLRGITFNHLLGMYNPAQYLVQFSGAMVAFSVAPLHFTRVLPRASVGWMTLDNLSSDPRKVVEMVAWMRKNGLKEFAEDYELWSKTGYRESVVNSNADYTSVLTKNLPYDAGVINKALSNHTVFYKAGELANTRMAFATAVERYKSLKGIKKVDPDDVEALNAIMKDAETLRLNMSTANQATFNKGWTSVPLQFQQVVTKYFSKILPEWAGGTGELTRAERARLTVIPTMVAGMGGVPLAEHTMITMMSWVGTDANDWTPEETQIAKNGVIGYISSDMLDLNVDFSSRMTLAGDALDRAVEGFTRGKAVWEWLGPTSNVADRYYRNGQFMAEAFDLSVNNSEKIDMNTLRFMGNVLTQIAVDIPSLSRNIKQYSANFLTQNRSFIRDGKYMFELESMNDRTALFGMFGFQSSEVVDIYNIDKEINDERTSVKKFGDTDVDIIRRVLNDYLLSPSATDVESQYGALMINAIFTKYGEAEAHDIMKKVFDKTSLQKDSGDLLVRYLEETDKKQQEGLNFWSVLISGELQKLREQK